MKRSKSQKENIDKMIAYWMVWICLSIAYFTYAYFYRLPVVIACILAIVYVVVSYILLNKSTLPQKNLKILLVCTLVIVVMTNTMNVANWWVEDKQVKEYHAYLETKPENILLHIFSEETP